MSVTTTSGQTFFSIINDNFQGVPHVGTVQFLTDVAQESFVITIESSSLRYSEGVCSNPDATVTLRQNLLAEIITTPVRHVFDARVVEFSSRISITGDRALGRSVLDLVKVPAPAVVALMQSAKKKWPSSRCCRFSPCIGPRRASSFRVNENSLRSLQRAFSALGKCLAGLRMLLRQNSVTVKSHPIYLGQSAIS